MRTAWERISAALWVAEVLLRTELGRRQNVRVAIIAKNGRIVVRQRRGWDAYGSVDEIDGFEEFEDFDE